MNKNLQQWFNLLSLEQVAHIKNLMASIYNHEEVPIYPLKENVFKAFELTSPEEVKVVLLGQDPYHTPGQAQGLAFSLPDNAPTQPSMRNILKELESDLGESRHSQDLTSCGEQGVLITYLNQSFLSYGVKTPNLLCR